MRLLTSSSKRVEPDDCVDYVKRLVGLPRDRIQVRSGVLFINDVPVRVTRDGEFTESLAVVSGPCRERRVEGGVRVCVAEQWIETLPEGVSHMILNTNANETTMDNTETFVVPDGHFFFMGDHRDNSQDSRADVGFVPFENLIGRADLILLSSEGAFWEFWEWRGDRFFKAIE